MTSNWATVGDASKHQFRLATANGLPEIQMRRAKNYDRAALQNLFFRSWMEFWAPHLPEAAVKRFRAADPVSDFLDDHLALMEVAECHGSIVGVILVHKSCLKDLHVLSQFQGRGIGKHLLLRAEELGANWLEVRSFNEQAIRFYEKSGWTKANSYWSTEMGVPVISHKYVAPYQAVAHSIPPR